MTFPSLNIEKLRHDTIQKVKKEKQDKENAKKLQQKQYDYQNYLNLSIHFFSSCLKNIVVNSSMNVSNETKYFDKSLDILL